jgi:hypothetical protein
MPSADQRQSKYAILLGSSPTALAAGIDRGHLADYDALIRAACEAIGSRRILSNALAIESLNILEADQRPVFDRGVGTLRDTEMVSPAARLHPASCELVNTSSLADHARRVGGIDRPSVMFAVP